MPIMRTPVGVVLACFLCLAGYSVAAQESLQVDTAGNVQVGHAIVRAGNTYDAMPVGAIIMYDGDGWVDDETIPGWYACTVANAAARPNGYPIPDLETHFIAGVAPEDLGATTAERYGGANEITLTEEQLPTHTHSINHDHASVTTSTDTHSHTFVDYFHLENPELRPSWADYTRDGIGGTNGYDGGNAVWTYDHSTRSDTHSHSVNLPNFTGTSGSTGGGEAFDNRPAFYTVIFIRKCYQPTAQ